MLRFIRLLMQSQASFVARCRTAQESLDNKDRTRQWGDFCHPHLPGACFLRSRMVQRLIDRRKHPSSVIPSIRFP
jgi:hypothetical protein